MLSPITIQHITEKYGKPIRYPRDCMVLSVEIESATKKQLGVNTLKRMLGFIDEIREPRLETLDIIAKYLGFENWDIYWASISKEGNSEFGKLEAIKVMELKLNDQIEFHYTPDRIVVIQYCEDYLFDVVRAEHSKLLVGDKIEVRHFYLNYPLKINDVIRKDVHLGSFTAGKISGITFLKKLTD